MKTHRQPGLYCDARPDGQWAALVPNSHIDTDKGRIDLPGEDVLQHRLARDGRIVGQGHQSGHTQLWGGGAWAQLGACISQDGHVWDEHDRLLACRATDDDAPDPTLTRLWHRYEHDGHVTVLHLDTGSIGIRQVLPDGEIVPAWKSYADPARGIWNYTDFGDVAFGQGHESGFVVRFADDGILRLIEPGTCMFNRVNRDGDLWSIAIWRLDTKESVFYWFMTEELQMLKPVQVTLPPLGRKIDVGYFYRDTSAIQYGGDNPDAPCTVSVIVDPLALPAEPYQGKSVPMIIDPACLTEMARHPEWWPLWQATYLTAEGDEVMLERMANFVRFAYDYLGLPPKPLVSYTAGHVFPNALSPTDILGIQAYAHKDGELPVSLYDRIAVELEKVRYRRVALICQCYDRLSPYWTGRRLAELQPVYWKLAQAFENVEKLLLFSDGRKGGTRDYPEMRPWHRAMVKAGQV